MEKYEITKEQILELENGFTLPKLKQWFPEAFKVKLEIEKWYKWKNGEVLFNYQENGKIYGFLYGKWHVTDYWTWEATKNIIEATEKEVFEALKNESVKRGLIDGAIINTLQDDLNVDSWINENQNKVGQDISFENGNLYAKGYGKYCIFKNGTWATIIETITKEEAEKLLNKKIV